MPNQVMLNDFMKYPVDWETSLLGDVVDINPETIGTGTPGTFHFKYIDISSVNLGNISWDTVTNQVLSSAPSRARRVARSEDVLFSTVRPGLQSHAYAEWPMQNYYICSTGFAILRAKRMHPRFLYHLIFSDEVSSQVRKLELGSNYPAINESDVSTLCIPIPPGAEQRRIAEILDTIDEAIQKTEALISKLKAMKQGLLHDLLTRGLDKNGKLRDPKAHPEQFKDSPLGKIPIEWRVGSISSLAINHDNRRVPLKQADRDKRHGIYPYYGASGIIDWIDDYLFDGDFVLLGEDGENVVSRELPLAFRASGRFWVNNHAHVFEPLPEVDIRFLIELLEFTQYKKIIIGSAQPKITQDGLKRLLFRIPELDEQVLIAERLEIYDTRISTEEQYRDKLKFQKKGLMHDLLAGKVRVKV